MNSVFHGIGLMSGTSLDGLDIAYCHFYKNADSWSYQIDTVSCISFPKSLLNQLKSAPKLGSEALLQLDIQYGRWIGEQVNLFISQNNIRPQFISSHGYTVFHQPKNNFTHQIGSGDAIYAITHIPVINTFRQLDICLGGQGAPLVPIGDELLFNDFDVCLNIGGITNLSFKEENKRVAYDICPANMVLNSLAEMKMMPFDKEGNMAKTGSFIPSLYNRLEDLAYYKDAYPKSLGFEWVDKNIFSLNYFNENSPEDLANTFVAHIANRIKVACLSINLPENSKKKILVTGGGSHNDYLLESIQNSLNEEFQIIKPNNELINYKEAMIFAFLGLLRLRGETNVLKTVTGASEDSCSGHLTGNVIY
jgi:anhydro-N-acetylmuramic acid kinase